VTAMPGRGFSLSPASRHYYFLGSCLARSDLRKAREYMIDAIRADVRNVRAWGRLIEIFGRALFEGIMRFPRGR
jgi:hypothetical protein